jgi:hypothetical protein
VWRGNVGWVLVDVYARRLSGLEDELVCSFRLAEVMIGIGI